MVSERPKHLQVPACLGFPWLNGSDVVLGMYCHIIAADVVLAGLHAT